MDVSEGSDKSPPRTGAKKRGVGAVDEDGPEAKKRKVAAPVGAAGEEDEDAFEVGEEGQERV